MASIGFSQSDFRVFEIEGFSARMEQIGARVRPRLARLGAELAPELARKLHLEFFPHVAKHMRRTVNPPAETWTAWGPSPKGYKRYAYLALCISSLGLHARVVVKPEADHRAEMARRIGEKSAALAKSLRGAKIARYDRWDFAAMPAELAAGDELLIALRDALGKKSGTIDAGFGWPVREAVRLDRAEVIDAFGELEPIYRILRSAD
ncbi:MAG TPA: DUF1054 family protein [Candidatus Binataceae bacterium]|nr:DUF1054 family protein [Candidatus Binataceae bacterium]